MKGIKEIIKRNLTGKKVLLTFLLTNVIYAIMLFITIPRTMAFSDGMRLLDMMPMGYDSEYVVALFETLGEKGREAYLHIQLPIDMIYPLLFGISYCLLIAYFLKKIDKLKSAFFFLCFLPLVAGIADYLENFGIITMLISYPNLSEGSINATNIFSIVKSMATTTYFVALIIILLILGIKTIKERTSRASKDNLQ